MRQRADADGKRPQLLVAAFGEVLQIGEPLPIEDDRYLTFEYIGAADHLAEARPGIARQRGRFCTSTDAAICHRRPDGGTEIALIEWKYTESYKGRAAPKSTSDRLDRCRPLFEAPGGPMRTDVISYADLFVEPFYQLMRHQLLAHAMERSEEPGADTVRVLHVAPATNSELQLSRTRDSYPAAGATLYTAWRAMLRRLTGSRRSTRRGLRRRRSQARNTSQGTHTAELKERSSVGWTLVVRNPGQRPCRPARLEQGDVMLSMRLQAASAR